ncbi:MAG: efflux transporter periplasmic adaptor subunit [Flavobacteriales bacterium]|nr:MAG: efflux transporter periplasmic adaptor subunit [Flavobacteriales bacterium]
MAKRIFQIIFYLIPLFIALVLFSCKDDEERILPEKRNLVESVYSSVTVQPDSLYQVYSVVSGIIDKVLVEEGQAVNRNNAIISIINNTPKLNTQNARLALQLAKENYSGNAAVLKGIADEIAAAKLKFENDSINYYRQKNLWEQNIGSKAEFDAKKLNLQLSKSNLQLLISKYNRAKNELQTSFKQAKNNYQTSLINTRDFTVKSMINGKVYAIYKNRGEIVTGMEPLAAVGSSDLFINQMLVDEEDIVKIAIGQKVIISLDAYKDTVFTGHVTKILPKKDERNQTFVVEAHFNNPPKTLYPGLSGEANIIISKKDSVLAIPKNYLINNNQVRTDEGLVTIKTGLQNLEYVEVHSGITKNTYLYKPEE